MGRATWVTRSSRTIPNAVVVYGIQWPRVLIRALKRLRECGSYFKRPGTRTLSERIENMVVARRGWGQSSHSRPMLGSSNRELWSGARDLNPGPHGPEPAVHRVFVRGMNKAWTDLSQIAAVA